ncbi:hypothetical protein RHGRI_006332 [Rhododendron griersonianum]|uniref:AAA+ ATPase domain-containing protein n=1 Tax=Rhododendron griersonianum TaxID=479676 RepID=A0AAV6KU22_9ERIC|nr:hypothetical protein RHGRI_006332 [Rhododendron griersonianum]
MVFDEAVKAVTKAGNYVRHYRTNLDKLQTEMTFLEDRRKIIEKDVKEAHDRGEEIEVDVARWQTDTNTMKIYVYLMRQSRCSSLNIKWRYRLGKQAEEKIEDVKKLAQGGHFDRIARPKPPPPEFEFLSVENFVHLDSRTPIFGAIVGALRDPEVKMIGIHGLGGVGKTTLVEKVAKNLLDDGTFKQVPLVAVSKDHNVKDIQKKLADKLNFALDATKDEKGRAIELWNKFKNGEKYLVILDDIWEKVDLKAIGIPVMEGNIGCKVVLTSRKEKLLRTTMKADRNFPIVELPEEEAWDLFKKKVGNTIESQPEIDSLARQVCRKCKGLPVAINALGAALEDKPGYAWKNALDKLEKHMLTQIEDVDPSVWASLWVSFEMLRSSDAQSCFLLCCLFAEDAEIPIDELMRHCMARSLLAQNPRTFDEARTAMCTVVDVLKSASLLSTGNHETVVKIHDVIRDVGISIAREKEAFMVDHGALRWPRNPTNGPSYKAMSLSFKNIKEHPDGLVYPQLETLMVDGSKLSDLEVPDTFFNGMKQLTVLVLTRMRMRRLPSSLAKLGNLRMLCLNECELDDIVVLKDLKSTLEVLSLRDFNIEALPPEIGQLAGLRVLDLRHCYRCKVIPRGVVSNLTSLEELYFPNDFGEWGATTDEQQDTSSEDNASLEELRESLANAQLTTLHIHVPNVKLLPKEDLKFADLKGFRISVGSKFEYVEKLISRTCMLKLEGIQLRNEFIPLVDKAEVLVLKPESSVYPLRLFDKLTVLIIEHFKLKYLFSPTTARGLVHLEVLEVTSCEIMEGIVGFEEQKDENEITGEVKFSKLKELRLKSLPNLISFFAKKEEMGTTMGSFSARAQPLFNELVIFPVLKKLSIQKVHKIIEIWDKQSIAVLEEQGPFCQLTDLDVAECEKLMHVFPSKMHSPLKNLKALSVSYCPTMEGIVDFGGEIDEDGLRNKVVFPVLKSMNFWNLDKITRIWDDQPLSEPEKEAKSFSELEDINVDGCDQLEHVLPSYMLPQLKNLQELSIESCTKVEVIISNNPKEKEATNDNDTIRFPQLKTLKLWSLPNLKSFICSDETQSIFSNKVVFPVLKSMNFWNLDKITRIWDDQPLSEPEKEAKSFSELEDINVDGCDQLEHVLPSYMLPQLKNLQELSIESCTKVEVIISNNPKEKEATNDNDTIRFPQLKTLKLWSLPNLKSFICSDETQSIFSNKVAFPVLEELKFLNLDKITRIWDNLPLSEPEKEAKSFCQLKKILVKGCKQLEYLLPFYMLPQLKNLQELSIRNCTKVEVIISNNPKEKETANNTDTIRFPQLKEVYLQELPNLKSFICSDETQSIFSNKVTFPVLKKLSIRKVHKIIEIWDKQSIAALKEQESFCQLTDLDVSECEKLMHVFPPKMRSPLKNLKVLRVIFPVLKKLSIRRVRKIIEIWAKQSIAIFEEQGSFCQLTDLDVSECEKLMHVFPSKMHSPLNNLKVLRVSDCPTMKGIVEFEGEIDEDGLRNEGCFSKLSLLKLSNLPNLESFFTKLGKADTTEGNSTIHALPLFNGKVVFPVLKSMKFWNLYKITRIWDDQPLSEPEKEAKSFSELEDINLYGCDQLEHVLPSYMLPQLKNLQELSIESCTKVEVIISNNPKEKEATNDNDTIRFPQLKTLKLWSLPNLKSFICSDETQSIFSNKVAFPVLERLSLEKLDKITRIWDNQSLSEPEEEAKSFCQLMWIIVFGCEDLEYVLPSYMLPRLKNLQKLKIRNCTKVEVIISNNPKEKEATNNNDTIRFPQLKTLKLEDLPNLKSFIRCETQLFFSNKVAFPVLEKIKLDEDSEILRDGTYTKEVSMEECSTSGKKSDPNGEELDEDLETPTKEISMEECSTSGEESDHNGEELDEDLETPTKEVSMNVRISNLFLNVVQVANKMTIMVNKAEDHDDVVCVGSYRRVRVAGETCKSALE